MSGWIIEPAAPMQRAEIVAILAAAALPTDDLERSQPRLWIARPTDAPARAIVGTVGLELLGQFGLLRSLAVQPALRGGGLGSALVARVEAEARAAGVTQLVLLTTTAADFFAKHHYRVAERSALPPHVLATSEFRELCPATATVMIKTLERH